MRNFLQDVSIWLFHFTDGVELVNTPWIIPWVLGGALILGGLIFLLVKYSDLNLFITMGFAAFFLFVLLVLMSPGAIQNQMMTECDDIMIRVVVHDVDDYASIKVCRKKDNYFGEYGDWKLTSLSSSK